MFIILTQNNCFELVFPKKGTHKKTFFPTEIIEFFRFHCEAIREKVETTKLNPEKLFLIAQAAEKEKHFHRYYHRRYRK
jgi:hypothetical protein